MKVRCYTTRLLPAGEMIDKETGELIKWGIRTECKLFLPDEPFPSDYVLKGEQPLGDGQVDLEIFVKKERVGVRVSNFALKAKV